MPEYRYSVVIPTYNPPRDLPKRVARLIRRCGNETEWIVVDDGSDTTDPAFWDALEPDGFHDLVDTERTVRFRGGTEMVGIE